LKYEIIHAIINVCVDSV